MTQHIRLAACPVCGTTGGTVVFQTRDALPVFCNALLPTADAARTAPAAHVRLQVCPACSHVWNAAFEESLVAYDPGYENSLHFSPVFHEFASDLAERLVTDHDLAGRAVVEIGSGKGDFLALLLEAGVGSATGYDPSYAGERDDALADPRVTVVPDVFPTDPGSLRAALVCTRHVLEHVAEPQRLLAPLRTALSGSPAVLYAEVPDGEYLLRNVALWDVIYEHPQHFTPASLHRLVQRAGFGVERVGSSFGEQYLWVEGRVGSASTVDEPGSVSDLLATAERFAHSATQLVDHWADVLAEHRRAGRSIALWGAGSKGVTFLNLVPGARWIQTVVDLNPRKHGRFVPGTGHQVVGPAALTADAPDVVLVMNPMYAGEIADTLHAMGVDSAISVVDAAPVGQLAG